VQPGSAITLERNAHWSGAASAFRRIVIRTVESTPALEAQLIGLPEGTHTRFELPAGAAFGERSPTMQQWLARQVLTDMGVEGGDYAVGDVLQFPTPDRQGHFAGTVIDLRTDARGDAVQFDFNHPLAGQPVTFEVQVIGVL